MTSEDRPSLFERIDPPAVQGRLAINQHAAWYTWAPEARRLLAGWSRHFARLDPPALVRVRGGRQYDATFSIGMRRATAFDGLAAELRTFARALRRFASPAEVQLFTRLLDREFDGTALHYLFALVRDAIAEAAGDDLSALYAPLGAVGPRAGPFPLHCDLYAADFLLNVFEDVPPDGTGASLFLDAGTFVEILGSLPALPETARWRIESCLRDRVADDRFAEFFALLHGRENPWVPALEARCRAAQMKIKLGSGQGYLIHDRRWLHGRTAPRGGVGPRRVHRLVFTAASSPVEGDAR